MNPAGLEETFQSILGGIARLQKALPKDQDACEVLAEAGVQFGGALGRIDQLVWDTVDEVEEVQS